jgi:hypothetical protein
MNSPDLSSADELAQVDIGTDDLAFATETTMGTESSAGPPPLPRTDSQAQQSEPRPMSKEKECQDPDERNFRKIVRNFTPS